MLPELVTQIKNTAKDEISGIHTAVPAKIISFDAEKCEAEVQPLAKFKTSDGNFIDYPKLSGVPVMFMQGQQSAIIFPVKPYDECMLFFSEKTLEVWRNNGTQSDVNLQFDLTDAVAMVGRPSRVSRPDLVKLAVERSAVVVEGDMVIAGHEGTVFDLKNGTVRIESKDLLLNGRVSILGNLNVNRTSVGKNIGGAFTINKWAISTIIKNYIPDEELTENNGSPRPINIMSEPLITKGDKLLGSLFEMMCAVEGHIYRIQKSKDHSYVYFAELEYFDENNDKQELSYIFNGYYPSKMGVFCPVIKGGREVLDKSLYEEFVPTESDGFGWQDENYEWVDFYVDIEYFLDLMDKIGIKVETGGLYVFDQKKDIDKRQTEIEEYNADWFIKGKNGLSLYQNIHFKNYFDVSPFMPIYTDYYCLPMESEYTYIYQGFWGTSSHQGKDGKLGAIDIPVKSNVIDRNIPVYAMLSGTLLGNGIYSQGTYPSGVSFATCNAVVIETIIKDKKYTIAYKHMRSDSNAHLTDFVEKTIHMGTKIGLAAGYQNGNNYKWGIHLDLEITDSNGNYIDPLRFFDLEKRYETWGY